MLTTTDIHAHNTFDDPTKCQAAHRSVEPIGPHAKIHICSGFRNPATTQTRMSGTDTLVRALCSHATAPSELA